MKKTYTVHTKYFKHTLKKPIKINHQTLTSREGFYCIINDNESIIGIGECAPLPGLSHESIETIKKELEHLTHIDIDKIKCNKTLPIFPIFSSSPSIQFSIESALLMNQSKPSPCYCHKFIINLDTIPAFNKPSYIKCKIGLLDIEKEIKIIKKIIEKFPTIKYRFDANNQLSLEEALYFIKHIPKETIDYIESPCKTAKEEAALATMTSISIAQDSPKVPEDIPAYCKHIVLKPTLIGNLASYLMKLKHKKNIIFSSAYESIIGLSGIAYLASHLSPNQHHGLNTNHIFTHTSNNQTSLFTPLNLEESINWIKTHGFT